MPNHRRLAANLESILRAACGFARRLLLLATIAIFSSAAPSRTCRVATAAPPVAAPAQPATYSLTPNDQAPLAPLAEAAQMRVPAGFHVSLFAGEPDVMQPIARRRFRTGCAVCARVASRSRI